MNKKLSQASLLDYPSRRIIIKGYGTRWEKTNLTGMVQIWILK